MADWIGTVLSVFRLPNGEWSGVALAVFWLFVLAALLYAGVGVRTVFRSRPPDA